MIGEQDVRSARGARASQLGLSCIAAVLLTLAVLLGATGTAHAFVEPGAGDVSSSITVTQFGDPTGAGTCPKDCSLRQALTTILPGGTVTLPAGTYQLSQGDLLIYENVNVVGAGARTTVIEQSSPAVDRVLEIDAGSVTLSGVTLSGGEATSSGTDNNPEVGGGIWIDGGAELALTQSAVTGNQADSSGGGIDNDGDLTVTQSTIENNQVTGGGGGGIDDFGSQLVITNSTIADDQAEGQGGGLLAAGPATFLNDTFTGNQAAADGGDDVYVYGGSDVVTTNTILAGDSNDDCAGALDSEGYNLASDASCVLTAAGDLQSTEPQLGPLADNGGPTDTLLPLAGSPAIDAATGDICPDIDQRGVSRPQGPHCDIGAVEAEVLVAPSVPKALTAPTVTGFAQQGQALTAGAGTWSGSPTSYTYTWERCAASCAAISGTTTTTSATTSTYTAVAADVGDTLEVSVTATNGVGDSSSATSAPTAAVVAPLTVGSVTQPTLLPVAPVSKLTVPDATPAGGLKLAQPATFDAAATTAPVGLSIVGYRWDLNGDGKFDTQTTTPVASHSFYTAGIKTVGMEPMYSNGTYGPLTRVTVTVPPATAAGGTSGSKCQTDALFGWLEFGSACIEEIQINAGTTCGQGQGTTGPVVSSASSEQAIDTSRHGCWKIALSNANLNGLTLTGDNAQYLYLDTTGTTGQWILSADGTVKETIADVPAVGDIPLGSKDLQTTPSKFPIGGQSPAANAPGEKLFDLQVGGNCTGSQATACVKLPGGVPLTGDIGLYLAQSQAGFTDPTLIVQASVALTSPVSITGSIAIQGNLESGIELDHFAIGTQSINIGIGTIKNLQFSYDQNESFAGGYSGDDVENCPQAGTNIYQAKGEVDLNAPPGFKVQGGLRLDTNNGQTSFCGQFWMSGLTIQMGPFTLTSFGGGLGWNPFEMNVNAGGYVGPIGLNAGIAFTAAYQGNPATLVIGAPNDTASQCPNDHQALEAYFPSNGPQVANLCGGFEFDWDGYVDGQVNLNVALPNLSAGTKVVTITGRLAGWIAPDAVWKGQQATSASASLRRPSGRRPAAACTTCGPGSGAAPNAFPPSARQTSKADCQPDGWSPAQCVHCPSSGACYCPTHKYLGVAADGPIPASELDASGYVPDPNGGFCQPPAPQPPASTPGLPSGVIDDGGPKFQFSAGADVNIIGVVHASGQAFVNNYYVGGCANVSVAGFGVGAYAYQSMSDSSDSGWGFGGCDNIAPYCLAPPPDKSAPACYDSGAGISSQLRRSDLGFGAGQPQRFQAPKGTTAPINLAVESVTGIPQVQIAGPAGSYTTDGQVGGTVVPESGGNTPGAYVVVGDPDQHRVTIALIHPTPGAIYTITPVAGSPAIDPLLEAQILPVPKAKAWITGRGAKRTLHYNIAALKSHKLVAEFVERASGGVQVLAERPVTAAHHAGTIKFTPHDGGSLKRAIELDLTVDNRPLPPKDVARYTAPPAHKVGKPAAVHIGWARNRATVSWKPAAWALEYYVTVRASDGRKNLFIVGPKARSQSFAAVFPGDRLTVTVQAFGGSTRVLGAGRTAHYHVRPAKPKRAKPKKKRGHR